MKFFEQIINHDPENGRIGDCYRTAIACIIDADSPEEVEHFGVTSQERMASAAREWLRSRGYEVVVTYIGGEQTPDEAIEFLSDWNPGIPFIFGGLNPEGVGHVVIAMDGVVIHDTSPLKLGIAGPNEPGVNYDADSELPAHYFAEFILKAL